MKQSAKLYVEVTHQLFAFLAATKITVPCTSTCARLTTRHNEGIIGGRTSPSDAKR